MCNSDVTLLEHDHIMFSRLRGHVSIKESYGTIEKERNSQQKTSILLRFFSLEVSLLQADYYGKQKVKQLI